MTPTPAPGRWAAAGERHGPLRIHLWSPADAADMGAYWARNRTHLSPTQPHREAGFWTAEGQRERIERAANDVAAGRMFPFLVREDGHLVGEIGVSDVVRGAFLSGNLGYSIDGGRQGLGIGSWAVAAVVAVAFSDLGLHRLQAGTLVDNLASQRVLERCGFERIGVATEYLAIAGRWRDHVLWQRVNPACPPIP